jgi:transposase
MLAHDLRAVLRLAAGRAEEPSAAVLDSRTLRSTPESGARAGWDGHKRTRGSKRHLAVDTLGHRPALHVTPASTNDRAAVAALAEAVQDATGGNVELAFVDQGYTGARPAEAAQAHGIGLEVVSLPEAKRGFILLPRRWAVERSFAWVARCRRLARDYKRLPGVIAGLPMVAFVILMLRRAADFALVHNSLHGGGADT